MRFANALVLVAACGSQGPTLEEKKLPGFTLGLPRGAFAESRANTYSAGAVRLELFEHRDKRINIKWQYTDKAEANDTSGRDDVLPLAPPGLSGVTMKTRFGDENIYVTTFVCDRRAISITTGLDGDAAKTVHTAIVKSVTCTPEANQGTASLGAVDLALPATFKLQSTPGSGFPSKTWIDEETSAVVATSVVPDVRRSRIYNLRKEMEKQLAFMQDVELGELVEETTTDGQIEWIQLAGSTNGARLHGYAASTYCKELDAFAVTVVLAGSVEIAAPLHKTVLGGRCRSSLQ